MGMEKVFKGRKYSFKIYSYRIKYKVNFNKTNCQSLKMRDGWPVSPEPC